MSAPTVVPAARYELASFGELLGDSSRAAMLLSLMDGRARPATELAELAGISPSTASLHLKRLLSGRVLAVERLGRHRYYRLAGEEVAAALETIAALLPVPAQRRPLDPERQRLAAARTCYHHLAGRLGVAWREALESQGLIALRHGAPALTRRGQERFEALKLRTARWPEGKLCLDWTERRHHLGGALGALLTKHLFDLRWIARRTGHRAVRLTTTGERELAWRFELRLEDVR